MSKYKPMLISFDEEGYNYESKKAEEKLEILEKAIDWINNSPVNLSGNLTEVIVNSMDESFCQFYTQKIWEMNKDKIQLDISKDKLLDLLGIDLTELKLLEDQYKSIETNPLEFYPLNDDGKYIEFSFRFPVNRKAYERYTSSAEENQKLKDYRTFIEALDKLSNHCHIYAQQIQIATSNFVRYDIRKGRYFPFM